MRFLKIGYPKTIQNHGFSLWRMTKNLHDSLQGFKKAMQRVWTWTEVGRGWKLWHIMILYDILWYCTTFSADEPAQLPWSDRVRYLWYDYFCCPRGDGLEANAHRHFAISCIPSYVAKCVSGRRFSDSWGEKPGKPMGTARPVWYKHFTWESRS